MICNFRMMSLMSGNPSASVEWKVSRLALFSFFLSQKKVSGILNHEDWLPILKIGLLLLLVRLVFLQSAFCLASWFCYRDERYLFVTFQNAISLQNRRHFAGVG